MAYSIKNVVSVTGLTEHTIRYYEKCGLLVNISRNKNGVRIFTDDDIFWIEIIKCLKNTGMKIEDIKSIVDLSLEGDHTCDERKNILLQHRKNILEQIEELYKNLNKLDLKIAWYENKENTCK